MMGKHTGASKGKGGSMHYYNKEWNLYGGGGLVGDQLPQGTGTAFAMKYLEEKSVSVVGYGDGSGN